MKCGNYNQNRIVEVGAEVFAAEFLFPESELIAVAHAVGISEGHCSAEQVVKLKRASGAKVSYTFLLKGLSRLGFAQKDQFRGVKFTTLEENLFGKPIYKQPWFIAKRARTSGAGGPRV